MRVCFVLLFLFAVPCYARTEIKSGQTVTGSVGDGIGYYMSDGSNDKYIKLSLVYVGDYSSTDQIQLHITNETGNQVWTSIVPDPEGFNTTFEYVCHSSTSQISVYNFDLLGTYGANYSLSVELEDLSLQLQTERYAYIHFNSSFFFYDVEKTDRPLEITVHSDDHDDIAATLTAAYEACPMNIEYEKKDPGDYSAFLSFNKKGRLSIFQFNPELKKGRWFISVTLKDSSKEKAFRISVDHGLEYSSYNARTLGLLFVFPCLLMAIAFIPFVITSWLNVSGWFTKTPTVAGEDSIVKLGKVPVSQRNEQYLTYVIICGIFFVVPALQLANRENDELEEEGDRNTCYYNDFCMKPDDNIQVANNIW
eukprot:CAMPEP_0174274796 /NCGR_PEP_ID=MMETSP0439-20130205/59284_1 /TAXON_ID=0 /ORGANISM="Stereomyxa ramosa, Strain Chinc5" /LENGTH=364 /DNA_ID=CAMNT_0015366799 /DNA_START=62 /DNA_END=1153 /DNA_ORIENTATION=-